MPARARGEGRCGCMLRLLVARSSHDRIATRCNILVPRVLANVGWPGAIWRTASMTACVSAGAPARIPSTSPEYRRISMYSSVPLRSGFMGVAACALLHKATIDILLPRVLADMEYASVTWRTGPMTTSAWRPHLRVPQVPLRKAEEIDTYRSGPIRVSLLRVRALARERQSRNARKTSERIGTYNL